MVSSMFYLDFKEENLKIFYQMQNNVWTSNGRNCVVSDTHRVQDMSVMSTLPISKN